MLASVDVAAFGAMPPDERAAVANAWSRENPSEAMARLISFADPKGVGQGLIDAMVAGKLTPIFESENMDPHEIVRMLGSRPPTEAGRIFCKLSPQRQARIANGWTPEEFVARMPEILDPYKSDRLRDRLPGILSLANPAAASAICREFKAKSPAEVPKLQRALRKALNTEKKETEKTPQEKNEAERAKSLLKILSGKRGQSR
jgi:hypothetical protein